MKMYSDLFWRLARAAIISKSADGFAADLQRDTEIGDRELAAVGDVRAWNTCSSAPKTSDLRPAY
jgi:hypothetical protein